MRAFESDGQAPSRGSAQEKTGQAEAVHRSDYTGLVRALVAHAFDVDNADLSAPTRRKADVALARQTAMYLSHVALQMSLSQVGRAFGRDRTTAAHACHVIEDRRDDPQFDGLLMQLEQVLNMSLAALPRTMARGGRP